MNRRIALQATRITAPGQAHGAGSARELLPGALLKNVANGLPSGGGIRYSGGPVQNESFNPTTLASSRHLFRVGWGQPIPFSR